MLPTPSTDHVSFDRVYEPAEDSFLFLDTLSSPAEVAFLTQRFGVTRGDADANEAAHVSGASGRRGLCPSPLVLEVGVGSGVILAFVAAHARVLFGRSDVLICGSDVNAHACQVARETVSTALDDETRRRHPERVATRPGPATSVPSIFQGMIQADLAGPLRAGVVDVLICNPPYVPTSELPSVYQGTLSRPSDQHQTRSDHERDSHLLSLTYAGGVEGMEVTNRLLNQLPDVLSYPLGVAYVLLCAQNRPELVKDRIRSWGRGWMVDTVGQSGPKGGWERLQIIRIWRTER